MKLREFRNESVNHKLHAEARRWVSTTPENALQKPPGTFWAQVRSLAGFFGFLFLYCSFFMGSDLKISMLTLVLPLVAFLFVSIFWTNLRLLHQREVVTLLPTKRKSISRQALRICGFLFGGMLLAVLAVVLMFSNRENFFVVVPTSLLILVAFIPVVQLISRVPYGDYLWAVLFLLMLAYGMSSEARLHLDRWMGFLPWHRFWENDVDAWKRLGLFFLGSGLTAIYLLKRGEFRPPFDRHSFYELNGAPALEMTCDEANVQQIIGGPQPRTPVGLIEKMIWRFLLPPERVVARAAGLCRGKFLSRVAMLALLLIGAVVLANFTGILGIWAVIGASVLGVLAILGIFRQAKAKSRSLLFGTAVSLGMTAPIYYSLPIRIEAVTRVSRLEHVFKIPIAVMVLFIPIGAFLWGLNNLRSFLDHPDPALLTSVMMMAMVVGLCGFLVAGTDFWNAALSSVSRRVLPGVPIHGLGGVLTCLAVLVAFANIFRVLVNRFGAFPETNLFLDIFFVILPVALYLFGRSSAHRRINDSSRDLMIGQMGNR